MKGPKSTPVPVKKRVIPKPCARFSIPIRSAIMTDLRAMRPPVLTPVTIPQMTKDAKLDISGQKKKHVPNMNMRVL